jgi:hypothetical protein
MVALSGAAGVAVDGLLGGGAIHAGGVIVGVAHARGGQPQVRPACRQSAPIPPPSVKPATPTVGQVPVGIARPAPANA